MNGFYIILLFLCCYGNDAFKIYDYDTYKDRKSLKKIKRNGSTTTEATVTIITTTASSTVTSIAPSSVSTIFEEWMLILIIVISILAVCGAIICCYCCFVKYKKKRKVKVKLKRISETINKNRIINDKKISDLSTAKTNYARDSSVCYERISTKTDIRLADEIYEVPNTASSVTSMSALVSDPPNYNNLDKEPIYRNTSSNGKPLAPPRLQKFLTEEKKDTSFYEHMNGVNKDGDVYNIPKQNSTEIDDPDIYLPLKGDDNDVYTTPKQNSTEIDDPDIYLPLKGDNDVYNTPKQSSYEIDAPEVYLTLKG